MAVTTVQLCRITTDGLCPFRYLKERPHHSGTLCVFAALRKLTRALTNKVTGFLAIGEPHA